MSPVETLAAAADALQARAAERESLLRDATQGAWRSLPINGGQRSDLRGPPELTTYDYRGDAVATAADSEFGACGRADAELIVALRNDAGRQVAVDRATAAWLRKMSDPQAERYRQPALAVARAVLGADA